MLKSVNKHMTMLARHSKMPRRPSQRKVGVPREKIDSVIWRLSGLPAIYLSRSNVACCILAGKYTALLAVLVVGSFVIPMAQYFWYVRDDDSSDKFFAEDVPEPPQKKGWF